MHVCMHAHGKPLLKQNIICWFVDIVDNTHTFSVLAMACKKCQLLMTPWHITCARTRAQTHSDSLALALSLSLSISVCLSVCLSLSLSLSLSVSVMPSATRAPPKKESDALRMVQVDEFFQYQKVQAITLIHLSPSRYSYHSPAMHAKSSRTLCLALRSGRCMVTSHFRQAPSMIWLAINDDRDFHILALWYLEDFVLKSRLRSAHCRLTDSLRATLKGDNMHFSEEWACISVSLAT